MNEFVSLNFGQISSLAIELAALEHLKIIVSSDLFCNYIQFVLIFADNQNWHNILNV